MSTSTTVPTHEFRNFLGSKLIPTQAKAYGYDFPTHIRTELRFKPFESILVVAIYEQRPQNFLDRLLKRTRYKLVALRTPGWGTIAKDPETKARADAIVFNLNLSHLIIKHNWYVTVSKLYRDKL